MKRTTKEKFERCQKLFDTFFTICIWSTALARLLSIINKNNKVVTIIYTILFIVSITVFILSAILFIIKSILEKKLKKQEKATMND